MPTKPQEPPERMAAVTLLPTPLPTPKPVLAPLVASDGLSDWLYKLRMCESSGNYAENTGNSFYGAYQFTIDTWNHWQTGYARADLAPAEVQDATIIKNTQAASAGLASQNPGCFKSQGLAAFPPG